MSEKFKWCPTQSGKTIAYKPEYKDKHDKWCNVPTVPSNHGVPADKNRVHVIENLGLLTYAQAQTLAWGFAAMVAANEGEDVEVRVQEYVVVYEIKARKAIGKNPELLETVNQHDKQEG